MQDHAQGERHLVEVSLETYRLCTETLAYALSRGGAVAEPERLRAVLDCADLSLAAAGLIARGSRFREPLARLCADAARACADAIEALSHEDNRLRATYAACHSAAQAWTGFAEGASPAAPDPYDEAVIESFPASDPPPL